MPSRGAVNRSADSWVPLDASFKSTVTQPGINVAQIAALEPAVLGEQIAATAQVNEVEGWAKGPDRALVQNVQSQLQATTKAYIQANMPNATVGDVVGRRVITPENAKAIPTSLPNRIVMIGARYAALPPTLQQEITFALAKDSAGDAVNPRTFPWAALNNQKVTLSFRPSTAEDEAAIRAFLPAGSSVDVSQLPSSIPAYLVRVTPELKVNGSVVLTGSPMSLGSDLTFVFNPRLVGRGTYSYSYKVPAGSYLAIATVAGSIDPTTLETAKDRLQGLKQILQTGNSSDMAGLSRDLAVGEPFYVGMLGYYSQYMTLGTMLASQQSGHHMLAAGVGSFGYEPQVDSFFGIPRSISVGGAVMNVPMINVVGRDTSSQPDLRRLTLDLGALSSMLEGAVPEQMFRDTANSRMAVSAVQALGIASQQGQRIYQVTALNQASALTNINLASSVMAEIRAAVSAGRTVLVHTDPIAVQGWAGAGYVILDPETGSAAWKISGGQSGGYYSLTGLGTGLAVGIAAVVAGPWVGGLVNLVALVISIINFFTLDNDNTLEFNMARIVGQICGVALSIILGNYVFITFPAMFYVSFVIMIALTLSLLAYEIVNTFSGQPRIRERLSPLLVA